LRVQKEIDGDAERNCHDTHILGWISMSPNAISIEEEGLCVFCFHYVVQLINIINKLCVTEAFVCIS